MREIARVQQGFFPTQDRIAKAVSNLFSFNTSPGAINVLDAGCGEAKAICDLRDCWLVRNPALRVVLHGIESDKNRCERAANLIQGDTGGGSVLWAAIEDAWPDGPVNLLWFNPPYDRIRGAGRTESALFDCVKEWPLKSQGFLLLIVPDYVLSDEQVNLAVSIEREYELVGLWRYPEPEYQEFNQCVLIARRREKALKNTRLLFPLWAQNPDGWPVLSEQMKPVAELKTVRGPVTLHRSKLSDDVILDAISKSPLRGTMLREATAAAPPIGRPLLPLKNGHLALALAGGLCDGVIEADGERFLIKGTLKSATRKTATREQTNSQGEVTAEVDVYRTRYEMLVRCLRSSGEIENYSSGQDESSEEDE